MSEYWKSTPKYWCKFCSLYVRDTKFERTQHEATGRHQSNIQRSLKGLHREQQTKERQKQQAKDEVARLNGLVPSSGSNPSATAGGDARVGAKPSFSRSQEKPPSLDDRKRQLNELAAMGVAVPEQVRGDMALAGDWQVVSSRVVGENGEEIEEKKGLNMGVRKRKIDEEEEEQIAAGEMITKKKGWGNSFRSFPGKMSSADDDLDALFSTKKPALKKEDESEAKIKSEAEVKDDPDVKAENPAVALHGIPTEEEASKQAAEAAAPAVVFKKRKKIAR